MTQKDRPTMKKWTDAWHTSDEQALINMYAENATVFPPKKTTLVGNESIVDYFKGGFGKVDVFFQPQAAIVDEQLSYEYGEFIDVKWGTEELVAKGKYSTTWIKIDKEWKILCHTFSVADPE